MRIQESTVQLTASHEAQYKSSTEISTTREFKRTFERLVAQSGKDEVKARERMQKLLQSLVDAILAAIDGKKCSEKIAATDCALPPEATTGSREVPQITWKQTIAQSVSESESTSVCGNGKVKTCDGRTIDFNYALDLQREYSSQKISTESGTVRLQDPLILSFEGNSCELTQERVAFDLNSDGVCEQIPGLGASSGFLVFDRNGNGKADNGSELFGVASGDGFSDLRELDSDRNGWIDEADSAWNQLAIWSGDKFASLAERGVGALYASAVDAPFSLKTAGNELLGQIRSAGLYLSEAGEVGQLQQVDLAVAENKA
ncbi:MAG: hypothetical protein H6R18_1596 [Proteobacteria bacterium]|nr:hypothetical protein [Pseudomonadota bacterium]